MLWSGSKVRLVIVLISANDIGMLTSVAAFEFKAFRPFFNAVFQKDYQRRTAITKNIQLQSI